MEKENVHKTMENHKPIYQNQFCYLVELNYFFKQIIIHRLKKNFLLREEIQFEVRLEERKDEIHYLHNN